MFRTSEAQCEEKRDREKKRVSSLFSVGYSSQDGDINNIDTPIWRKKTWYESYNPACDCPPAPTLAEIGDAGTEIFFNNNAERSAYLTFLDYAPETRESVLSLARADAWFTACTWLLSLPDGEGENRNTQFKDVFMLLLPRCLSTIIGDVYSVMLQNCRTELTFSKYR